MKDRDSPPLHLSITEGRTHVREVVGEVLKIHSPLGHLQAQLLPWICWPAIAKNNGMTYAQQGRGILDGITGMDSVEDGRQGLP